MLPTRPPAVPSEVARSIATAQDDTLASLIIALDPFQRAAHVPLHTARLYIFRFNLTATLRT